MDAECDRLLRSLPAPGPPYLKPLDFEKDNDHHMRALAACSNLRARNYAIGEADLHTSRYVTAPMRHPVVRGTEAHVASNILCYC